MKYLEKCLKNLPNQLQSLTMIIENLRQNHENMKYLGKGLK